MTAHKKVNITEEQSTLLTATFDDFDIEVFPLPEGSLTAIDGWGFHITDTYGDENREEVHSDESSLFNSARIALVTALSYLISLDYGSK